MPVRIGVLVLHAAASLPLVVVTIQLLIGDVLPSASPIGAAAALLAVAGVVAGFIWYHAALLLAIVVRRSESPSAVNASPCSRDLG